MSLTEIKEEELRCWSVSQLTVFLKKLIDNEEILHDIWVKGEISNLKRSSSGHIYFDIKDANSQLKCVFFNRLACRLKFKPENGDQVMVRGRISIYEKAGEYQMIVEEMRQAGMGELFQAFLQLKDKLEKEGLFDPARKKELPFLPRVIGIVTSPQAAALRDMVKIIRSRNDIVKIILSPALVQGDDAPLSIIQALQRLNRLDEVEVIIIGRGGGSFEELNCFNSEALAREIAASRIPVISAVGHETDFTIADFVSDYRAPTPSAAAQIVIPEKFELIRQIESLKSRLKTALFQRIRSARIHLRGIINKAVFKYPYQNIRNKQQEIDNLTRRLASAMEKIAGSLREKLSKFQGKLDALSPFKVLLRGYSLCLRRDNGMIVRKCRDISAGDDIEVVISDGRIYGKANAVMREAVTVFRDEMW